MIDEQAGKAFEGVVDYQDADGNSITLDKLCRKEPAWAASRLRAGQERITELELAADGKNHMLTGCTESLNKALERVAELEAFVVAYDDYAQVMFTDKIDLLAMSCCGAKVKAARKALSNG